MNKKNNIGPLIVSSLALFSMFFGAGNMIFPPTLGYWAGSSYLLAIIGFLITSVGLVILALVSTVMSGGTIESNAMPVSKNFALFFGTCIMLAIGPGLAIPRTAATSFEILQGAFLPGLSPLLTSLVFFGVVLFFSINPSNIVNKLGKILTPVLVVTVVTLITKGIISPIGAPVITDAADVFSSSFELGYQTMDALAAFAFTNVLILGFINQGVQDTRDQAKLTVLSGVIAGIGLSIIYGGLLYVGSTTSSLDQLAELSRTELLIYISQTLLGDWGLVVLALAIILACLTTAIGLTASVATYFERSTGGKINYRTTAILSTVFSIVFAVTGVDRIVTYSAPVLGFLYPVAMILIVLNLLRLRDSKPIMVGGVVGAIVFSILDIVGNYSTNLLAPIHDVVPEYLHSFLWAPFALVFIIIFVLIDKIKN